MAMNGDMKGALIDMAVELGAATINAAFPYDFEYYIMALELVDSRGDTVSYFAFPVMPNNYSYNSPRATNIKETMTGVNSISSMRFVPIDISISGNFGKKIRTLMTNAFNFDFARFFARVGTGFGSFGNDAEDLLASNDGIMKQNFHGLNSKSMLSVKFKTGYGTLKVMETMLDMAEDLDTYMKPHRLYLHNPARGDNFLVKVTNFKSTQDMSSNMIWNYDLQLKAVAPLGYISDESKLGNNMKFGAIQKIMNKMAQMAAKRITKAI